MTEKQKEGSEKYFHVMEFFRSDKVSYFISILFSLGIIIGFAYWLLTLI